MLVFEILDLYFIHFMFISPSILNHLKKIMDETVGVFSSPALIVDVLHNLLWA